MRELNRACDPELGEAGQVLGRQALRMLDPVAQALRLPVGAGRLEGVERVSVRLVADRMDADRPATLRRAADDFLELGAAGDLDAAPVGHQSGLRSERAVHEALQVADAQVLVTEARAERQRSRRIELLVRDRSPDAQREVPLVAEVLED